MLTPQSAGTDVLITGIPRSGTSYFCTVLHNIENCVVINEPEEIFAHLDDTTPPWGMQAYYDGLRAMILEGRPVLNKIVDGRLIEDTAVVCRDEPYLPAVTSPDFLLATKNTLGYLARLPHLVRALQPATLFACVRNPFDTIASWKATFAHLAAAAVRDLRRGFRGDPLLRESARRRLEQIDVEEKVEVRRARFWTHLAELIREDRESITGIVRYEDLASDPAATLSDLMQKTPRPFPLVPRRPFQHSAVRRRRLHGLTAADVAAIRHECRDAAEHFGYDVDAPLSMEPS
jgi:hypothetical protein